MKKYSILFAYLVCTLCFFKANQDLASYSFNETSPNKEIKIDAKVIPDIFKDPVKKIRSDPGYRIKVPIVLPSVVINRGVPLVSSIASAANGYTFTLFKLHNRYHNCLSKTCEWGYINGFIIREDASPPSQELQLVRIGYARYKKDCDENQYPCTSEEIEQTRQKVETAGFKVLSRGINGLYTPLVVQKSLKSFDMYRFSQ